MNTNTLPAAVREFATKTKRANGHNTGKPHMPQRINGDPASAAVHNTVDEFASRNHVGSAAPPPRANGSGVSSLLQLLNLRQPPQSPPRTVGAQQCLLSAGLMAEPISDGPPRGKAADAPQTRTVRKWMTVGVLSLLMLSAPVCTGSDAQTTYVNVNGASTEMAEVKGAKLAAKQVGEAFRMIKPAELAGEMARADGAGQMLRKLVVSGHSGGSWISGKDASGSYSLGINEVKALAEKHPAGFAKVQQFYAMACNVGTEENSRQWMALFPNLKALVGFDRIAPSTVRPAAGIVLSAVDAELQKVNWGTLTRERAISLAQRLSKLDGVNMTEFSIRLAANDGTTVYYSKLNKPTTSSAARDLYNQHKPLFTSYLGASDARFASPPDDHDNSHPLRPFYNAAQAMMNALGRDLVAQGSEPTTDQLFKQVHKEKEQALKLIYFSVVKQNVEFHKRALIDQVVREVAAHGATLSVPNLTTLTRGQIVALHKQLVELGNFTFTGFAEKHAAELASVGAHLKAHGKPALQTSHMGPKAYDWQATALQNDLKELVLDEATPADVKDAASRLISALSTQPSAEFKQLIDLFDRGLVQLDGEVILPDWVTTERNG